MTDKEIRQMYDNVKRPNKEWSLAEAIRNHSQACGVVAFVLNVHPDEVARAVMTGYKECIAICFNKVVM